MLTRHCLLPPAELCHRHCLLKWLFPTHTSFSENAQEFCEVGDGNCGKESVLLFGNASQYHRKTMESQQLNTIEVYTFFGHILTSRGVEDSDPYGHAGTQAARGSAFFNCLSRLSWSATFSWKKGEVESIGLHRGGGIYHFSLVTGPSTIARGTGKYHVTGGLRGRGWGSMKELFSLPKRVRL